MSIERKCENCFYKEFYNDFESWTCRHCISNGINNDYDINCKHDFFKPNGKAIRQDERDKIITLLKSDLENYSGLIEENEEEKMYFQNIRYRAIRKYIEETIKLLETEQ